MSPRITSYNVCYTKLLRPNFLHHFHQWAVYLAPYPRVPEFLQGALAAQLLLALQKRPPSSGERMAGDLALGAAVLYLGACLTDAMINRNNFV